MIHRIGAVLVLFQSCKRGSQTIALFRLYRAKTACKRHLSAVFPGRRLIGIPPVHRPAKKQRLFQVLEGHSRVIVKSKINPKRFLFFLLQDKFISVKIPKEILSSAPSILCGGRHADDQDPQFPAVLCLHLKQVRTLPDTGSQISLRSEFSGLFPPFQVF